MLELIEQDMLHHCPADKRDELEEMLSAPLDAGPADEVLAVMVQMGQGQTIEEAREIFYFQKTLEKVEDPMQRATKSKAFMDRLIASREQTED